MAKGNGTTAISPDFENLYTETTQDRKLRAEARQRRADLKKVEELQERIADNTKQIRLLKNDNRKDEAELAALKRTLGI